jgi:hypothetical protein
MPRLFYTTCLIFILFFPACTKDNLLTGSDARIITGADIIHFDTTFTNTGSVTKTLLVYNENNQRLKISSISLGSMEKSFFRINVNGQPGPVVNNIEIAAHDSIYIFINTNITSNSNQLPFVVQDSILIEWNENKKWIQLDGWGQNAHYIRNGSIKGNIEWNNSLPYVILGPLTIEENAVLQIRKGTRIYHHADAPLLVDGTLIITGDSSEKDRVIFTGDRLDEPHKNYPASWPGIYFRTGSHHNRFDYAIIQNAYQAIVTEGLQADNKKKLQLNQVIIDNAWDAGLVAINSSVEASNCLISNSGKNVQLIYGGEYSFTHCTIAGYSTYYNIHKDPVLVVSDGINKDGMLYTAPLNAEFINTICWGDNSAVENEVVAFRNGNDPFSINFKNGFWKMKTTDPDINSENMFVNIDPEFESAQSGAKKYDFRLKEGSPARDKGIITPILTDLDGKNRKDGNPDLGAYEKQ